MMIDEDRLGQLLADAADSLEVPEYGPARVLAARDAIGPVRAASARAAPAETTAAELWGNGSAVDGPATARSKRSKRWRTGGALAGAAALVVVLAVGISGRGHQSSSASSKALSPQHSAAATGVGSSNG
ncbi:MAG: hypothetical protein M3R71_02970, partial [Actinomycetota bacterium]|nr:hypothetical protein [Actinomycetota bacterium]